MSENPMTEPAVTAEGARLAEARDGGIPWKLWGPYLSERQWGTVREDYSESGDAWNYFNHGPSGWERGGVQPGSGRRSQIIEWSGQHCRKQQTGVAHGRGCSRISRVRIL
jgi:hypothetical protein